MPAVRPVVDVKQRRREVLAGLSVATCVSLLLVVVTASSFAIGLLVLSLAATGAYVAALRQLQLRRQERRAKVRVLRPAPASARTEFLLHRSVTG